MSRDKSECPPAAVKTKLNYRYFCFVIMFDKDMGKINTDL